MINVSKNSYIPLKLLNYSAFFQYQRFLMPISFLFYLENNLTFSDFIFFQSIFNITCLSGKIIAGYLGDIFSKKYLIIIAYLFFFLRVFLWSFWGGYSVILAGEILFGLFKAFYRGNVDSYIYEYLSTLNKFQSKNDEKNFFKMIKNYGNLSFYSSLGSAISCIVGVLLFYFYNFKTMLYIELFFQLTSIFLVLFIPNIKIVDKKNKKIFSFFKIIYSGIKNVLKSEKTNIYVFYSSILTGLTSIFVWNFQLVLKLSNAHTYVYGITNSFNQFLRGCAGKFAKKIIKKYEQILFKIEYYFVILSFIMLLFSIYFKNYIIAIFFIIITSISILFFVVFNIYTISNIHKYSKNYNRAVSSSINTFLGDFAAFIFLLVFKLLYDLYNIEITIILFLILSLVILLPGICYKNEI